MAGEVSKTTILTNIELGVKAAGNIVKGHLVEAKDKHAYGTGELEATDYLITGIEIPSNAVLSEILVYNDDLDSNGTPALAIDIGIAAGEKFVSTTSSVDTVHSENDVLDADLFVDGDITLQAATTKYTSLGLDSGTMGPDDAHKEIWELLGYDVDPMTKFRVCVTVATAAATAAAGDVAFLVRYSVA